MKKLIAVWLCLLLLCPCALAEDVTLTWADIEPEIAKRGLSGGMIDLPETGLRVWIPDGYSQDVESADAFVSTLAGMLSSFSGESEESFQNGLTSLVQAAGVSNMATFTQTSAEGKEIRKIIMERFDAGIPDGTVDPAATSGTVNGRECALWKQAQINMPAVFNPSLPATEFHMFGFIYTDQENGILLDVTLGEEAESDELNALFLIVLASLQPLE